MYLSVLLTEHSICICDIFAESFFLDNIYSKSFVVMREDILAVKRELVAPVLLNPLSNNNINLTNSVMCQTICCTVTWNLPDKINDGSYQRVTTDGYLSGIKTWQFNQAICLNGALINDMCTCQWQAKSSLTIVMVEKNRWNVTDCSLNNIQFDNRYMFDFIDIQWLCNNPFVSLFYLWVLSHMATFQTDNVVEDLRYRTLF